MTRSPPTNRAIALRDGYYIRQGAYLGTTDDRRDRWYVGRKNHAFQPYGPGYATQEEAWKAAADAAREKATV